MNEVQRPQVPTEFAALVSTITQRIAGMPLDGSLENFLQAEYPPEGAWFRAMAELCVRGCADGWLCAREQDGIKFGRPIKPSEASSGFSVDVVEMTDVVGPHHRHPNGEIDLVMPLERSAEFDGKGAGWLVYGPGSAHCPTVAKGKALVLYLLPEGTIEFTA